MSPSQVTLHEGDCLKVMRGMAANSVDTVLCDPPYSLEFMGKDWDKSIPGIPYWKEMLRVAKPGAMLMAFGGTRTHHRLMCAIEDAGWIIRDVIMWVYGSGFPKSHNIGKAIDRTAMVTCHDCEGTGTLVVYGDDGEPETEVNCHHCNGEGMKRGAEREVVGLRVDADGRTRAAEPHGKTIYQRKGIYGQDERNATQIKADTAPATPAAATWEGWGTALKPAWEPIILAMKPLDGTYAQNALKWGVAGLWIDGGRVEHAGQEDYKESTQKNQHKDFGTLPMTGNTVYGDYSMVEKENYQPTAGRWPANLIHDGSDEVLAGFPQSKSTGGDGYKNSIFCGGKKTGGHGLGDSGSAARFFYCAKSSKRERNAGLPEGETCIHPTVKPLALMRHLCRLSRTPSGGVVLDPFMGSGSTGCAAILEDRSFIGIDKETEYIEIARRRIAHAVKEVSQRQLTLGI